MTLAAGLVLALGLMAGPALAQGPPEHGHVLLLHADFEANPDFDPDDPESGPPWFIYDFARCVELANGRPVPNNAHHANLHQGTAGEKTRSNAGHLVVPLTPLTPFTGCDDLPF